MVSPPLSRTLGSREIGGKAYRLYRVIRENQSRQWVISFNTNKSAYNLYSPGLSPCLNRMSAPRCFSTGIYIALNESTFKGAGI